MKIIFIAGTYPSEFDPTEALFIREAARAASLFNDVAVIHGGKDKNQKEPYRFSVSREDGFLTVRFTYRKTILNRNYSSLYVKSVLRAFQELKDRGFTPQVVQANGFATAVSAAMLKKKAGIPFVVREGNAVFLMHSLSPKDLKKAFFMQEAAVIMPLSKTLQRGIESYGIKGRFELVPCTVDTALFYPGPKKDSGGSLKKILMVAKLGPRKGIEDMLEALKLLREKRDDFVCRVVGYGEKEEEEKYRTMVKEYNLSSQVLFLGKRVRTEVAELMRDSNFFVLPTRCEPFGNVVIEALASGLPVIVTDVASVTEYFRNTGFGIFIPPKNIELLAKSVDYLLDHHSEYNAEKMARYAKEKFGYETVGRRLTEIYRSVAK